MNSISQTQLQDIAQIMATASGASKVILFGSRARGDFDASSDWDFLLVMPESWNPSCLEEELHVSRTSHDLVLLLRTIEPQPSEAFTQAARDLNYFLPRARYPNERNKLDADAVGNAIKHAKLFRAFARERLGLETL